MADSTPYDLSIITQDTLTPIVREVLNNDAASIITWDYVLLTGGAGGFRTVSEPYRFYGKARLDGKDTDWSLVLKVVGTTANGEDDPSEPRYWKREVLAYQSGELEHLPDGLTAPRFYGSIEFAEKMIGLWLEDVKEVKAQWTLDDYGVAARHLGRFNGAYLTGRELPDWDWLSRDLLREAVTTSNPPEDVARFRDMQDAPMPDGSFHDGDAQRALQVFDEREQFFAALNRLPQTLLHRDAHRRNLFVCKDDSGNDRFVAIDWAVVGIGAIGEELATLVRAASFLPETAIIDIQQLEAICIEGYLAGLADVGWQGDPRLVRLGYAAGTFLGSIGRLRMHPVPEEAYPFLEQAFGMPARKWLKLVANMRQYTLDLADEARELMAILD